MAGSLIFGRKRLVAVQLFNFYGFNEVDIDIGDVDLVKRRPGINQASAAFQITKENFQVKIVSGNSFVRVAPYGGVIIQKLH